MDAKRIKLSKKNCGGGAVNNIPIRTLYVSPINADMSDQIKWYFEPFGTVNFVKIEQDDNTDTYFGLVEFKKVETAIAVLSSKRLHRIDGFKVQVKAAEPWHQPDHIFNALDDDCLRMILLELNLPDLTNAANVCVRFNQQAKSIFSTKFKKLNLIDCSIEAAENLLKTFGSVAQSIDVGIKYKVQFHGVYEIKMLPIIAQYCTSELKEFKFYGFNFQSQPPNIGLKFNTAFSKLERLSFIDCLLRDTLNGLLSACVELKALHIERCRQYGARLKWPKFNKLQELRLLRSSSLNVNFIKGIITMNSNLLKISTSICDTDPLEIIRTIVQNNPNLLELEFIEYCDFMEIIRCISRLTSLKVLKLSPYYDKISAASLKILTDSVIPIEHLQLSTGKIDTEAIEGILQMKQLKVLELDDIGGLTDEHIILLAKGLGFQLEKLQLNGFTPRDLTTIGLKKMLPFATKLSLLTLELTRFITIDADDYKTILATIQKRPKKVRLSIELIGKWGQVSVDETVLKESRDIFYIDKKN